MPWVPLTESGLSYEFKSLASGGGSAILDGSTIITTASPGQVSAWHILFPLNVQFHTARLTSISYQAVATQAKRLYWGFGEGPSGALQAQANSTPNENTWTPPEFNFAISQGGGQFCVGNDYDPFNEGEYYTGSFLFEVFVTDPPDPPVTEDSPVSDQFIRMSYSDDGGHNWSNWQEFPIGEVGEYAKKVYWTRLGSTYQRVYRFTVSSPRKRDILGATASIKGTVG